MYGTRLMILLALGYSSFGGWVPWASTGLQVSPAGAAIAHEFVNDTPSSDAQQFAFVGARHAGERATRLARAGDDPPKPEPKPKPEDTPAESDETKDNNAAGDTEDDAEEDPEETEKEPEDKYFAIIGGTVHTITDGELHGVTILTKNGKIERIGKGVAIPEGAETLDAFGLHVYPGLVAVASGGIVGGEPPEDTTDVYGLRMTIALAGGITTAMTGQTAAKLTFGTLDDITIRRNVFTPLRYSTREADARRTLRAAFEKVRQYLRDLESYEEKKKTDPDEEEPDKEWIKGQYDTCLKLMRHETVAIIDANTARQLIDVCDLAERYGIRVVVRGAYEGWTVASRLARAGVSAIITPRKRQLPDERSNRPTGSSIENASILHDHGVPIAIVPGITSITTWGVAGRDLLHLNMEAAFAVRGGLSNDAALRAITIDAARILGIDHRVGSIEVGKDADLIITDGDVMHYMTLVRHAIVNGRIVYDKQKESLYDHIRPDGDTDAPPPDDYWPRRLGADQ